MRAVDKSAARRFDSGSYNSLRRNIVSKRKLTESEVDELVEKQANDDSAWEKPIQVQRLNVDLIIERDGFWLLTRAGEYFVSFADYPDFVGATLEKIFNLQENNGDFYWPDLDIDIELEALQHPERFPLKFKR